MIYCPKYNTNNLPTNCKYESCKECMIEYQKGGNYETRRNTPQRRNS